MKVIQFESYIGCFQIDGKMYCFEEWVAVVEFNL